MVADIPAAGLPARKGPESPDGGLLPDDTEPLPDDAGALLGDCTPPASLVLFPADYCALAGASEDDFAATSAEVAYNYYDAQLADCRTAGLTASFGDDQGSEWYNYLDSYTLAMARCPLLYGPIDGGIDVFGPGNTAVIGVPAPRLGPDDAALLTQLYVQAFGDALELTPEQRQAVTDYLLTMAAPLIEPAASGVLSLCAAGSDAGP